MTRAPRSNGPRKARGGKSASLAPGGGGSEPKAEKDSGDGLALGFVDLTPERLLDRLEALGLTPSGHFSALLCLENRVYDVRLEDGRHVVVKLYRPGRWSRAAIEAEHRFLADLAEAEIPVARPLEVREPKQRKSTTVFEVDGVLAAIWPRIGGRSPDEILSTHTGPLGRLLARLHSVGRAGAAPARRTLDGETFGRAPARYLVESGWLPPHLAEPYRRLAFQVADTYDALAAGVPTHRIHGDCHRGNLLYGSEGWFFVDFDDFVTGPAVQDVWMLVPAKDDEGQRLRAELLESYRSLADFSDRWLRLIEPLRALRYIHYAAWVARRHKDPAFRAAFPDFGDERYWQGQIEDLREQIASFPSASP